MGGDLPAHNSPPCCLLSTVVVPPVRRGDSSLASCRFAKSHYHQTSTLLVYHTVLKEFLLGKDLRVFPRAPCNFKILFKYVACTPRATCNCSNMFRLRSDDLCTTLSLLTKRFFISLDVAPIGAPGQFKWCCSLAWRIAVAMFVGCKEFYPTGCAIGWQNIQECLCHELAIRVPGEGGLGARSCLCRSPCRPTIINPLVSNLRQAFNPQALYL